MVYLLVLGCLVETVVTGVRTIGQRAHRPKRGPFHVLPVDTPALTHEMAPLLPQKARCLRKTGVYPRVDFSRAHLPTRNLTPDVPTDHLGRVVWLWLDGG